MKIYVSGKIRGAPLFGVDVFERYTRALRANGHEVFSPIENTRKIYGADVYNSAETFARIDGKTVFRADMCWLIDEAEAIFMLPGHRNSEGALAELQTARALGKKIFHPDAARGGSLPGSLIATKGPTSPIRKTQANIHHLMRSNNTSGVEREILSLMYEICEHVADDK